MDLRIGSQWVWSLMGAVAVVGTLLVGSAGLAQTESDCSLPPLSLPLFDATPVDIVAATPVTIESVPEVDQAEVERAIQTIITCANSGDHAVAYSIFTDRYLASLFLDPGTYLPAFEQQLAGPSTGVDGSLQLDAVVSFSVLADGRVEVVAELHNVSQTYTDTFVLAYTNGVWLIDDVPNLDPQP